jgi:hypothetical protein
MISPNNKAARTCTRLKNPVEYQQSRSRNGKHEANLTSLDCEANPCRSSHNEGAIVTAMKMFVTVEIMIQIGIWGSRPTNGATNWHSKIHRAAPMRTPIPRASKMFRERFICQHPIRSSRSNLRLTRFPSPLA